MALPDRIVSGGSDGTVRLWSVSGGALCAVRVDGPVWSCAWHPNGSGVAVAGVKGLYLFDLVEPSPHRDGG